jgi:P27 family predicted phage terminase small subunit
MRGRKPKTSSQRQLAGNPGHRPVNDEEPQITTSADAYRAVPPELTHPAAIAEWRRLVPLLTAARQVSDADHSALMALCIEWGRYLEALSKVTTLVVLTPSGYPMPNPYLSVATKALVACTKLWPELGLTPSSRTRVRVIDAPAADPFAEFDPPPIRYN